MAVAKLDLRDIDFDLDGHLDAGGLLYTYEANTMTPLATYADNTGGVANANPIVADSSGQRHIWLTVGVSYKFVFKTSAGVTIYTENGVRVADPSGSGSGSSNTAFDLSYDFLGGPPTSSQEIFRYVFARDVDFPADWTGAYGSVGTNPTSSFVETVKKNGSTVGTITTNTSGVSTFATSGGATVSFAAGDKLTVVGPGSADVSVANIARTFAGTLG